MLAVHESKAKIEMDGWMDGGETNYVFLTTRQTTVWGSA